MSLARLRLLPAKDRGKIGPVIEEWVWDGGDLGGAFHPLVSRGTNASNRLADEAPGVQEGRVGAGDATILAALEAAAGAS